MADFADIVEEIQKTNSKLDELNAASSAATGASATEDKRDAAAAAARSENYLKTIADAVSAGGGPDPAEGKKESKKGGLLAGIGGALSGLGLGAGAAMGGLGALFAGGGYLLKQISEFDGKKVKENVLELVSIGDALVKDSGGLLQAFGKTGLLVVTLGGIGLGLAALSVGTGAAAAVTKFTEGIKWSEDIKKNVEMLLSIETKSFLDTTGLLATMGGLGAALIAFSIGSTTAVAATGIDSAISMFTGNKEGMGTGWAKKIKDDVEMLLSIETKSFMDTTGLIATLGGLGGALIAFSVGKAAGTAAAGFDSAISMFTGKKEGMGTGWAQKIKDEVELLLNINTKGILETAGLIATMAGLGGALIAFSVGKAAGTAAAGFDSAISMFTGAKDGMGTGWADDVKKEVETLLSINVKIWDAAKLIVTLGGLGAALIAFSIGKATGTIAEGFDNAISMFTGSKEGMGTGWADAVKKEVETLLSIKIKIWDSAKLIATLGGLGAALIAFSIGKVVATGAEAIGSELSPSESERKAAFDLFNKSGWAQTIVNEVTTLLKIGDLSFWDAAEFVATMGMVGAGLVAFGVGKMVAGAAEGLVTGKTETENAVKQFSEVGFAQKIVDEVTTLLSIAKLPLGDAAKFAVAMGAIGGGLVLFSLGKGAAGAAEAINRFAGIGQPTGKTFAEKIKDEVTTLLSIVDDKNIDQAKADKFNSILGSIAEGLAKFGAGSFVGSLGQAAGAVLGFLTGTKSPIEEMKNIAAVHLDLKAGADAIDAISASLEKVGKLKFEGDSIKMDDFAEDLVAAVPLIEGAIMGGEVDPPGLNNSVTLKGLASADIKWADAGKNIELLMKAFNIKQGVEDISKVGVEERQGGGPISEGTPYMVGEMGPEIIVPSASGQVMNAQRTQQMQKASLEKSVGSSGGQTTSNISAPTNISTNQSNTTVTATPLMHPSPIIGMVNSAA